MIPGLWQKLGGWPKETQEAWESKENWIWFHGVSVGELNAVWPLVLKLNKEKPKYPIMVSTTTKAGFEHAKKLCREKGFLAFYFPLDFPLVVKSLYKKAKVKLLVIVETEIWPQVLSQAKENKIPILLVNAKISDRSFKRYKFFRFYFKNIVNLFSEVLTQSDSDSNKFIELGIEKNKVTKIGNIKFSTSTENGFHVTNEKITLLSTKEKINIIFASTHPGEDEIAIKTYKNLKLTINNLNLIIAPRHITRTNEICKMVTENDFNPVLRSKNELIKSEKDIFILDTIGELSNFYKISEITVLCGTFSKIGGHNILEPIRAGSYTIIGPNDFKILELSNLFKNKKAITQVNNEEELTIKIKEAINNPELRRTTIENGIKIIKENEHLLEQTTKHILAYL